MIISDDSDLTRVFRDELANTTQTKSETPVVFIKGLLSYERSEESLVFQNN